MSVSERIAWLCVGLVWGAWLWWRIIRPGRKE
jgi:hypothetical protein